MIERVLTPHGSTKWHPDSSTGITPSAAPETELGMRPLFETALTVSSSPSVNLQDSLPSSSAGSSKDEDSEDGGVALT